MPIHWDFHKILSVEPTRDTCAATTSKGPKCTKPLNPQKRRQAELLLFRMDRQKVVPSTKFSELAEEMLCKEVHNSQKRPWLNQVQQVSDKWQDIFEDHVERGKLKRTQSIARQPPEIKSDRKDSHFAEAAFNDIKSEMTVCYLRLP
jgi:hypothetical protein